MPEKIIPMETMIHPDLSVLMDLFPPWILRTHPRFKELTGYTGRTMANLDCLGKTAEVKKIIMGNTKAYERTSFIKWLEKRSSVVTEHDRQR
jgi:hypothetical protein